MRKLSADTVATTYLEDKINRKRLKIMAVQCGMNFSAFLRYIHHEYILQKLSPDPNQEQPTEIETPTSVQPKEPEDFTYIDPKTGKKYFSLLPPKDARKKYDLPPDPIRDYTDFDGCKSPSEMMKRAEEIHRQETEKKDG